MNLNPIRSEILEGSSALELNLEIEKFVREHGEGDIDLEILNVAYSCYNPKYDRNAREPKLSMQGHYSCLILYRRKKDN